MKRNSSIDWQVHLDTGRKYLKTAVNGRTRRSVFNNKLTHQLTAMAMEHLLVSVYYYHQKMPEDHTLDGLVDGIPEFCSLSSGLAEEIKSVGRYEELCPMVPVKPWVPNDMEIQTILAIGRRVADFADLQMKQPEDGNPL
jgi:hypothetical protein